MIVVDASALLEVLLRTPAALAVERRVFDYSDLEAGLARLDQVLRQTQHALDVLTRKIVWA